MNKAAIESLRTFAITHGQPAFAHLCTAALQGEHWATERMEVAVAETLDYSPIDPVSDAWKLIIISETDTLRPDGATARALTEI